MFDLNGKVAVITGGARGIGRAIAEGFCQAGSKVVVADIDYSEAQKTCAALEKSGAAAFAVKCDVSRRSDADNLIRATIDDSRVVARRTSARHRSATSPSGCPKRSLICFSPSRSANTNAQPCRVRFASFRCCPASARKPRRL